MRTHIRLLSVLLLLLTFPSTTILADTNTDTIKLLRTSIQSKDTLIEDLMDEKDTLSKQLEIQREEKKKFEKELILLQKNIGKLDDASRSGQDDAANLRLQKESLMRQLNKVRKEKVRLEDTISKLNKSMDITDSNVNSKVDAATSALKTRVQELKLQLISLEEKIENSNTKQSKLQKEIHKLENEKASLTKKITLRDKNISTLKRQLVDKINAVRKPLQNELRQTNAALAISNNVVRDKQLEVSELNRKYELTLVNIRELNNKLDKKDIEIEELNNKIKSIQIQTSEKISSISDQAKKDIETQRGKVQSKNKTLQEEISDLSTDKKDLQKQISDKKEAVRLIRRDRKTLQTKLDQLLIRNKDLLNKTAKLQNDINAIEDSIKDKISEAKQPLLGEIKKLEDNIKTLSRHMNNKHEKIDLVLEENKRLKTQLDKIVTIKNNYSKDNALLKTQLKLNSDKVAVQISSVKKPLEKSIQSLQEELNSLRKTNEVKGQEIKALEQKKSKLKTDLDRLSTGNTTLSQKVNKLELSLKQEKKLQSENIEDIQSSLLDKIITMEKQSNALKATVKEKGSYNLKIVGQNKSLTKKVAKLVEEKTGAFENLKNIQVRYNEIKSTLDKRIKVATKALTEEVQQLTVQLKSAQSGLEGTDTKII